MDRRKQKQNTNRMFEFYSYFIEVLLNSEFSQQKQFCFPNILGVDPAYYERETIS